MDPRFKECSPDSISRLEQNQAVFGKPEALLQLAAKTMSEGYTIIDCLLHKGAAAVGNKVFLAERCNQLRQETDRLIVFLKTHHRFHILDIFNDIDLSWKAKIGMSIVNGPLLLALW